MGILSRIRKFGSRTMDLFRNCAGRPNRVKPFIANAEEKVEKIIRIIDLSHNDEATQVKADSYMPPAVVPIYRSPSVTLIKVKPSEEEIITDAAYKAHNVENIARSSSVNMKRERPKAAKGLRKCPGIINVNRKMNSAFGKSKNDSDVTKVHILNAVIGCLSVESLEEEIITESNDYTPPCIYVQRTVTVRPKAAKYPRTPHDPDANSRTIRKVQSSPQPTTDENGNGKGNRSSHSISTGIVLPGEVTEDDFSNMAAAFKAPVIQESSTAKCMRKWMERKLEEDKESSKQ